MGRSRDCKHRPSHLGAGRLGRADLAAGRGLWDAEGAVHQSQDRLGAPGVVPPEQLFGLVGEGLGWGLTA